MLSLTISSHYLFRALNDAWLKRHQLEPSFNEIDSRLWREERNQLMIECDAAAFITQIAFYLRDAHMREEFLEFPVGSGLKEFFLCCWFFKTNETLNFKSEDFFSKSQLCSQVFKSRVSYQTSSKTCPEAIQARFLINKTISKFTFQASCLLSKARPPRGLELETQSCFTFLKLSSLCQLFIFTWSVVTDVNEQFAYFDKRKLLCGEQKAEADWKNVSCDCCWLEEVKEREFAFVKMSLDWDLNSFSLFWLLKITLSEAQIWQKTLNW